jgi:hypothetical protein
VTGQPLPYFGSPSGPGPFTAPRPRRDPIHPPGGVADLTVAVPTGGEQGELTVTCRASFPTPAQRAAVAVPGATARFLIDPANPTVITLPT